MLLKLYLGTVLLVVSALSMSAFAVEPTPPAGHLDVLFSPGGGCEARVVAELGKARKKIRLQAFTFTSQNVVKALSQAKARGVDCEVLLDKSNRTDKFSSAVSVRDAGVSCFIDDSHTVANNKVIVIDDATVLTGSYNFTKAAESSNAENLLVITGMPEVALAYAENYLKHRAHAKPYTGPSPTPEVAPPGGQANVASAAPADAASGNAAQPLVSAMPSGGKGKVWVTANGKKYHAAGCEFLHGGGREIERSAIQAKYTPCSKCHP